MTPHKILFIDLLERGASTFAQALLAMLAVAGTDVLTLNWTQALSVSATAALTAVLKGYVAAKSTNGTASALPGRLDPAVQMQDNPNTDAPYGKHSA